MYYVEYCSFVQTASKFAKGRTSWRNESHITTFVKAFETVTVFEDMINMTIFYNIDDISFNLNKPKIEQ